MSNSAALPPQRNSDEPQGIEDLLSRYVDELNEVGFIDPQQVLADHPDLGPAVLEELKTYIQLRSGGNEAQPLGTLGDYTLRRQIGRGGMGVVYEAWQNSLDRQVALKVLPAGIAADNRAFMRFMREAKTAAQLQHPNVVAVYGMGVEQNTPYYAMEYVEGETLAQLLKRLKDTAPEAETPFGKKNEVRYFANLAVVFADVADGLQHAHTRGIIHRDIKPSNLILDPEADRGGRAKGRLRILDFGLAHLEGQESLSATGDLLGTPLYMSPEQARRKKIEVDHRTDVYSLGATLYEMLAERPPFQGKDHQDTLSQIIQRDPRPPRQLNSRVPRELETIVLKCLRKDPADRYGTAEALGQDLRRFFRGDPIEAKAQTVLERWSRTLRRHRTLVAVAAALLAAAFAGLTAGGYLIWREEQRTREALTLAKSERTKVELQRQRADRNFQKAREAVDLMLTQVSESTLENMLGMEDVRRSLLEKASAFYQGLLAESANDPELRREAARASRRLGDIFLTLGRHAEAENACRQAIVTLGELLSEDAENPECRHELARSHLNLGELLLEVGRHEDAAGALETSRNLFEKLAADHPNVPSYAEDLGSCEASRGKLLEETGQYEEAERAIRRAIDLQGGLLQEDPRNLLRLEALSSSLSSLASVLQVTRDISCAEEAYRHALSLWHSVSGAVQEKPEHLARVCEIRRGLALLLMQTGRVSEAESTIQEVLAVYQKLTTEAPLVPDYQLKLSGAYSALANIAKTPEGTDEARRQAAAISRKVAAAYPHVVRYRRALAAELGNLANWLSSQGQDPIPIYRETIEIMEEVVRRSPQTHRYRRDLAMCRSNLAAFVSKRGRDLDEAREQLLKACAALRELRRSFPQVHEYDANLAGASNNLGYVLEVKEQLEEAESAYHEAVAVQEQIVRRFPGLPVYRGLLSMSLLNRGSVLAKLGKFEEAELCLSRAIGLRRELLESDPKAQGLRDVLAFCLEEAGGARALAERQPEAHQLWEESAALRRDLAREFPEATKYRYGLACTLLKLAIGTCKAGKKERALRFHSEAMEVMETLGPPGPSLQDLKVKAGAMLSDQGAEGTKGG